MPTQRYEFTHENTAGYSDSDLAELNREWNELSADLGDADGLNDAYYEALDRFCTDVDKRTVA